MTDAPVLVERRDHILLITLNRPQVRNAVNLALAKGVAAAMDLLDTDETLRVGVISGNGGCFCAGMDLKAFAAAGEWPVIEGRGFAGLCERSSDKPLIAAVEGFAFAGGLEIALSCDMIVAARGARFGVPEVTRGLAAGAGALIRMPKRMPYHLAMQMVLTGEPITAERGFDVGFINALGEPGAAVSVALTLATRIAESAPLALKASKHVLRGSTDWTEDEAWRLQDPLIQALRHSADAAEGASAFAEKRKPVWQGK